MPKRIDENIRTAVFQQAINNRDDGAVVIHRRMCDQFGHAALSLRAVGSLIKEARSLPPEKRRSYREARWPDAFGGADLPWESASAVIELTQRLGRVPLIPLAIWHWRVSLAFPKETAFRRHSLAVNMALREDQPAQRQALGDAATQGKFTDGMTDMTGPRIAETYEMLLGSLPDALRENLATMTADWLRSVGAEVPDYTESRGDT